MSGLRRLFDRRPDPAAVSRALGDAVAALPGVVHQQLTYVHQPHGSGAISGVVDVDGTPAFLQVLRVLRRQLGEQVADRADRVTFYCTGRTPDGDAVAPGDLGLSQPPTGREVAERLL